ncbi:hypothetical protein EJ02DRAFT_455269 [Clathrospora elynae]|uniref:Uncharacterized protein n=1 Tax=Clathrospora elynae TaxID=706981 RepID=A0A6A5SPB4_9PLEO|nr:hypothetical protein EJ02DRAFT_455269 [Clathrospora elynae]
MALAEVLAGQIARLPELQATPGMELGPNDVVGISMPPPGLHLFSHNMEKNKGALDEIPSNDAPAHTTAHAFPPGLSLSPPQLEKNEAAFVDMQTDVRIAPPGLNHSLAQLLQNQNTLAGVGAEIFMAKPSIAYPPGLLADIFAMDDAPPPSGLDISSTQMDNNKNALGPVRVDVRFPPGLPNSPTSSTGIRMPSRRSYPVYHRVVALIIPISLHTIYPVFRI